MEEKLRRAFQLAYFILREERAAFYAAREAVAALDVMLVRQDKRFHYLPGHRTKVSLGEWQMLQRLVYFTSEAGEREQEAGGVAEAVLVMRYLKHLVYITVSRNSFFVALGLCRLLHNYSTAETAQIHELVVQDPDRGRDDSYYRRRKAQLMRELQARFGELLEVQRGMRGEERFQALPDAHGYLAWILEILREFTPWETRCDLPAAFDPHLDELPSLCFRGGDPDGEHEVEIRRLHALLHPDCFERMLTALRLAPPAERLEVPQFRLRNGHPPTPPSGGQPPTGMQLSEEEMKNLEEFVIQERERRRRFSPIWLRLVVDGVERARWSLEHGRDGRIEIAYGDKLIEIYGISGSEEVRLAAHFLSYDLNDQLRPAAVALELEGGQRLNLAVEPLPAGNEEDAGANVRVNYRETSSLRILLVWWHRFRQWLINLAQGVWPVQGQVWKPALAITILALFGVGLWYWLWIGRNASSDKLAHNATTTPQVSPTPAVITVSPQPPSQPIPQEGPSADTPPARPSAAGSSSGDEVIALDIRQPAGGSDLLTRSERAQAAGLLEAKKAYLAVSGTRSQYARRQLLQRLSADNQFSLTENPGEADVAIKVTLAMAGQDRLTLTVQIADTNGKVIWPLTPGTSGRKYEGPLEKAIATFSRELAGDLRQLKR
jgi:hypothetical protein